MNTYKSSRYAPLKSLVILSLLKVLTLFEKHLLYPTLHHFIVQANIYSIPFFTAKHKVIFAIDMQASLN